MLPEPAVYIKAASAPPVSAAPAPLVASDPEEHVSSISEEPRVEAPEEHEYDSPDEITMPAMPVAPTGDDLRPSNSEPVTSSAEEDMSSSSDDGPAGPMTRARTGARVRAPHQFVPGAFTAGGLPQQPLSKIVPETCWEALARPEAEQWRAAVDNGIASQLANVFWDI
jgi:hypothetical protein